MIKPEIFRAYDIRGIYPTELDEDVAYRIAQAYCKLFNPKTVILGRDVRLSGPQMSKATTQGFIDHGVSVIDIGVITTDMLYFAVGASECDGGMVISASHNPKEYSGLKLIRKGVVAVSGDSGIYEIRDIVASGYAYISATRGTTSSKDITAEYLKKCLSCVDAGAIKPLRVVANGMFGPIMKNVEGLHLPLQLIKLNATPDGTFPKGPPDPLLAENRRETIELIKRSNVDIGVAWDGDADRFFIFDENGRFIPGYYVTAFFGEYYSKKFKGAKIVHDPRLIWAVAKTVTEAGGVPLINKAGHAFIKERMRAEDAVFGGEMSGHYYFRDFYYADNGLIPFLLILEILSTSGKKLSQLFDSYFKTYFISEETNIALASPAEINRALAAVEKKYFDAQITKIDGISIEYRTWRANIRSSNTQPLLRINVESRSSEAEKQKKLEELQGVIANNAN